ncbi:hypothetical protein BD626DRAFT_194837 [Schizophyllum amplum]|uniref:Uncharacterized protein n=1 Tax=Schizophyllum amplum TaxID=97359 RepID=A0A550CME6_9AGAR|nr:hypothetical protein BD626DRAFT_194837 [Auriculariopsis ampla]
MQRQLSSSKQARHVPSLEYLRPSPVRGQLEPYDGRTARGWRYIQTTDTLNQLKVLLPPRTASLYAELLKAEEVELAKAPSVSWELILEIRHLKDRMVRKAQKLSPTPPPKRIGRGEAFTFQTVIAPSDFRLKEMEKWLHRQGAARPRSRSRSKLPPPVTRRVSQTIKRRNSFCCEHCSRIVAVHTDENPHRPASRAGVRIPEPEIVHDLPPRPSSRAHVREIVTDVQYAQRPPREEAMEAILSPLDGLDRARAFSPPPLPHPFRTTSGSADAPAEEIEEPREREPEPSPPQRQLHRRSSFKRQNAEFKTVSWALDNDECELSDYLEKAREAHASGRDWAEVRVVYLEQMNALRTLHDQVYSTLSRLSSETDHLQELDSAIKKQLSSLQSSFDAFEATSRE